MKLKIVSDGTVAGTNVVNAETGEVIENVVHISWNASAGEESPECIIVLANLEVDLFYEPKNENSNSEDCPIDDLDNDEEIDKLLSKLKKSI